MGTGSVRRRIDMQRLRDATRGPGADTRTWVALGVVDDDDDAIRWETPWGWIVDVTIQGGPLDQETIPCRVPLPFAGDARTQSAPIARGVEVLLLLPEGDPNAMPIAWGMLHNERAPVPDTVNGDDLDEALATSTHVLVTPHAVAEQIEGTRTVKTGDTHQILGPKIELADAGAAQSYVRGDDQKSALDDFLTSFSTWTGAVKVAITSLGGALDNTAIDLAVTQLRNGLSGALSSKIKGE